MKKSYRKPLVYCENHETGVVLSNSEAYKQEMKQKLAKMEEIESPDKEQMNLSEEI